MRRHIPTLLIALLPLAASASDLTPSAVLYSANQYHGQQVHVTGVITNLMLNTTTDGKPYETFKICDANACLQVYAMGDTPRITDKAVTVTGHFWMFIQRGYHTFHNELDLD